MIGEYEEIGLVKIWQRKWPVHFPHIHKKGPWELGTIKVSRAEVKIDFEQVRT